MLNIIDQCLPFYLSGPSFDASTTIITMMYLAYISGIIVGPLAGNLCNRIGNGKTMLLGMLVFGISLRKKSLNLGLNIQRFKQVQGAHDMDPDIVHFFSPLRIETG
jgi:MFS family permease